MSELKLRPPEEQTQEPTLERRGWGTRLPVRSCVTSSKSAKPLRVPPTEKRSRCSQDPSAPWPTLRVAQGELFAQRERKRKSATPVGMTKKTSASRAVGVCRTDGAGDPWGQGSVVSADDRGIYCTREEVPRG